MPKIRTQLSKIPLAGPLIMLAAALLFTVHNGFIKMIGPSFSAWDIAFYRFGCGLVILIAIFGWRGNPFRAIRHIPLSKAMVLFYAFPAFAAFFSQQLFGEKISRTEILFILVALGGVMVIFDYELDGAVFGQIMAVLAGIFAGLTVSIIRKLRASNGSVIIYLYFCMLGSIITLPSFIADPRIPATAIEWLCIGGIVGTSVVAQLLMTHGFQYCKSWEGGLYLMTEVIFTSLLGILFFIEIVDWRFWAGGLLIFGSALGLNHIRARSDSPNAIPSR
jgi:drug/metabolite transporter (DMT)-like permease